MTPGPIHVYPMNDILPHETNSLNCHCFPTIENMPNGGIIIIHNSFDNREGLEEL